MSNDTLFTLLLGAGGIGGLAGLFNVIVSFRSGKATNEEALATRLTNESNKQADRADRAELELTAARRQFQTDLNKVQLQRDRARDRCVEFRRHLTEVGFTNVPLLDDLYE